MTPSFQLHNDVCLDSGVVRTVDYHRGNPSSIPADYRSFRTVWRVRRNATNIQVLLRAKEHLTTAGEVTGRNVVKLTSQLKTGTKVRQLTSVILTGLVSSIQKKTKAFGVDGMMWGKKRRRVGLIDFVLPADPYFMLICMPTSLVSAFIMHINSPPDGISTHHLSLFLKL